MLTAEEALQLSRTAQLSADDVMLADAALVRVEQAIRAQVGKGETQFIMLFDDVGNDSLAAIASNRRVLAYVAHHLKAFGYDVGYGTHPDHIGYLDIAWTDALS